MWSRECCDQNDMMFNGNRARCGGNISDEGMLMVAGAWARKCKQMAGVRRT